MIYFILQRTDTAPGYKAITVLTGYRQWLCAIDNGVILTGISVFRPFARVRSAEGAHRCRYKRRSGFNRRVRHVGCQCSVTQTRKSPRWFAVSGFVRNVPRCVLLFLFGGRFLVVATKLQSSARNIQTFSALRLALTDG